MGDNIKKLFIEEIETTIKSAKNPDPWEKIPHCSFYPIKHLSIDERGRNGQEFIQNVFKGRKKCVHVKIEGVNDKPYSVKGDNEKTGEWDIKINNHRIEVKTACMDRARKFQHEGVKKTNNYDFIFFLDVTPNDEIYFGVTHYKEIPWTDLHERGKSNRPTGAGFKWDIKYNVVNSKTPTNWRVCNTVQDMIDTFEECCKRNHILP